MSINIQINPDKGMKGFCRDEISILLAFHFHHGASIYVPRSFISQHQRERRPQARWRGRSWMKLAGCSVSFYMLWVRIPPQGVVSLPGFLPAPYSMTWLFLNGRVCCRWLLGPGRSRNRRMGSLWYFYGASSASQVLPYFEMLMICALFRCISEAVDQDRVSDRIFFFLKEQLN